MAGFDNDVMYADNVDFSGGFPVVGQVTTDAQLLIGSTVAPNIRVGTLTSTGGSIAISYVSPNINIETGGAVASNYPVDNGGPGVPAANSLSILGSTSADFPNDSGNETHVGATTNQIYIENRRWFSSFVVDPSATVGLRGTFTTISAAIAAAVAPAMIYIRPGIYVEDISLLPGINLQGLDSGRSIVNVTGEATAAGNGITNISNMSFTGAVGDDAIQIINAGVGTTTVNIFKCSLAATFVATRALVSGSALGPGVANCFDCAFTSAAGDCLETGSNATINITNCTAVSSTGIGFRHAGSATNTLLESSITGVTAGISMASVGTAEVQNCRITCAAASAIGFLGPSTYNGFGNVYNCSAASTDYVSGVVGTYRYADEVNRGTATNIAAGVTQIKANWQPYCSSGTSVTAYRGTAGFDSTQFTVSTTGFVQLTGGPAGIVWSDQGASTTVGSNTGSFATAAIALTLPAAPSQGTYCEFVAITAAALAVTANAGQTITIGNQTSAVAGTATSTDVGDSLRLVFRSTALGWWAVPGDQGNWTVV